MAAISVGTPSSAAISTVQSARLANLPSAKAQHYWLPPVPSATAPEKPWCKIIARYRRAVRGGAAARPQTRAACRVRADFNNKVFQNAELKDSGKWLRTAFDRHSLSTCSACTHLLLTAIMQNANAAAQDCTSKHCFHSPSSIPLPPLDNAAFNTPRHSFCP